MQFTEDSFYFARLCHCMQQQTPRPEILNFDVAGRGSDCRGCCKLWPNTGDFTTSVAASVAQCSGAVQGSQLLESIGSSDC